MYLFKQAYSYGFKDLEVKHILEKVLAEIMFQEKTLELKAKSVQNNILHIFKVISVSDVNTIF